MSEEKQSVVSGIIGVDPFDEGTIKTFFEEAEKLEKQCFLDDNVIRFNVGSPYYIDLRMCNTPEKILDWVDQLCTKNWMTKELLQQFIELVCCAHKISYKNIV